MPNSSNPFLESILGSLTSSILDLASAFAWIVPAIVCTILFLAVCMLLCWIADDLLVELPWLSGPRFIFHWAHRELRPSEDESIGKSLR